ncbi:MAG: serine hydrolase domain-containing protein [Pseudomonadota bacterium]
MSGDISSSFGTAHAVLQGEVEARRLAGVSCATLRHGELIDSFCTGHADLEAGTLLRPDHIHRAFSNTKLFTTVLVLMLADEGQWQLDDPLKAWIPAFGRVRVLRPGATTLDDTEPLAADISIRQLITHTAGFSHGVFDPESLLYKAYHASGVRGINTTLTEQMDLLAQLPLGFQPGTAWEYALGIDVLARLCELATGQTFGDALQQRIFGPLGLTDTGFVLRPDQVPRLAALYKGDLAEPMKPGLERLTTTPWPDAYLQPVPRQSGAGGLFSTQADMLALLRQLMPGQPSALLKPDTLAAMFRDQLPGDLCVQFPMPGPIPSLGFGLGGALVRRASSLEPAGAVGELQWGGLAGTHWFISPATGLAGVVMCQRHFGFWHPFWFDYKRRLYTAAGH